jgi:hypothetical protein
MSEFKTGHEQVMIVYYDPFHDEIVMRHKGWNLFETVNFPCGNLCWAPPYRTCGGFGPKIIKLGDL